MKSLTTALTSVFSASLPVSRKQPSVKAWDVKNYPSLGIGIKEGLCKISTFMIRMNRAIMAAQENQDHITGSMEITRLKGMAGQLAEEVNGRIQEINNIGGHKSIMFRESVHSLLSRTKELLLVAENELLQILSNGMSAITPLQQEMLIHFMEKTINIQAEFAKMKVVNIRYPEKHYLKTQPLSKYDLQKYIA